MMTGICDHTLKTARRKDFIASFERADSAALRGAGIMMLGPLRDLEDENTINCVRSSLGCRSQTG